MPYLLLPAAFGALVVAAVAKILIRRARGERIPSLDAPPGMDPVTRDLLGNRRLKPGDYVPPDRLGSEDFE